MATFDTSMYGQIKPIEMQNPLAQAAQVAQFQGIQSQNRLADLVFGEKQREIADQGAIRSTLSGAGGDAKAASAALMGKGFYKQALEIDKADAERQKSVAAMEKDKVEIARKKLEVAGQAFGYVRNNPTLEAANSTLDYLAANGIYSPEQVAQYKAHVAANPTNIKALADQAFQSVLAADKQLPSFQTRNTGATTDTLEINPVTGEVKVAGSVKNTQSPDSVASERTASANRQQSERHFQAGQVKPVFNAEAGGFVVPPSAGNPTGSVLKVPGVEGKAPTEFQGKSAAFGARAEQADKVIQQLEGKYSPAAINSKQTVGKTWLVGGALEAGVNKALLNAADQKAEQAQRDFVNAVLRQESGAAIADSEFDNAKKQYFPQPGDGKEVIAQKAANRALAIRGLKNNAGKAALKPDQTSDIMKQADSILGL